MTESNRRPLHSGAVPLQLIQLNSPVAYNVFNYLRVIKSDGKLLNEGCLFPVKGIKRKMTHLYSRFMQYSLSILLIAEDMVSGYQVGVQSQVQHMRLPVYVYRHRHLWMMQTILEIKTYSYIFIRFNAASLIWQDRQNGELRHSVPYFLPNLPCSGLFCCQSKEKFICLQLQSELFIAPRQPLPIHSISMQNVQ